MKRVKIFKDCKDYEAVVDKDYDSHQAYNKVYILDEEKRIEAEARFEIKSARCAIKKFFRIIPDEMKGFRDFEEEMLEMVEDGRFSNHWAVDGFGRHYYAGWNVVDLNGEMVYISLRMSKDVYEGR